MMAISKRENDRREEEKKKPLKIIFYSENHGRAYWGLNQDQGGKHVKLVKGWNLHPHGDEELPSRKKGDVYIHLLGGKLSNGDCLWYKKLSLLQNQQHRYRQFRSARTDACYNDESIETYGSMEELRVKTFNDICS